MVAGSGLGLSLGLKKLVAVLLSFGLEGFVSFIVATCRSSADRTACCSVIAAQSCGSVSNVGAAV